MCSQPNPAPYIITVEGNIAAGKTTFLTYLTNKMKNQVTCFTEPLDQWTNLKGQNLLEQMYTQPTVKSFQLQVYIQYTVASVHMSKCETPIKVTERSLMSERFIFTNLLCDKNYITKTEFDILDHGFEFLNAQINQPNEIIYLRTKPTVAMNRLQARDRPSERTITIDYLKQLHALHDNWLLYNKIGSTYNAKVTILDQNQNFDKLYPEYDKIINRILSVTN